MFSLRTLLLAVVVVAIGVVGLTTRNIWWASVVSMLTWMAIAAAIIVAMVSRSGSRSFAIGFGVCSTFYVVVVFNGLFASFATALVTSRVVFSAWAAIDVPLPGPTAISSDMLIDSTTDIENIALDPFTGGSDESREYYYRVRSFYVVAHCLWAWLFGSLGALLAGYLAGKREAHIEPSR